MRENPVTLIYYYNKLDCVHNWSLQNQKSTCEITKKAHGMVHCILTNSYPAEEVVHVAGYKSISYHRSGGNERRRVRGRDKDSC